jgi:hypothetical protein
LIICLVQGLTAAISPYAGMFADEFIAIYLVSQVWFIDHPYVWWYDLVVCALLMVMALLGATAYSGICTALPILGITPRTCQSFSFGRVFFMHLWMLGSTGGLLWLAIRIWMWWKLRRR